MRSICNIVFGIAIVAALSSIGCGGTRAPSWVELEAWENGLFEHIDSDRMASQLPSLDRDEALDRIAGELAFLALRGRLDGVKPSELFKEYGIPAYIVAGRVVASFESSPKNMPRAAFDAIDDADSSVLTNADIRSGGVAVRYYDGVFAAVFVGALVVDTLEDGTPKPIVTAKLWPEERVKKYEAAHFARLNEARKENGLGELKSDDQLSAIARVYAKKMLKEGFFGHNDPAGKGFIARIDETNLDRFSAYGENLASLLHPKDPPLDAMTDLMNSPGHRANILRPSFTNVGIGAATDGRWWMFVQEFGTER